MKTAKNIISTFLIILLSLACALFVVPRLFGVQLYSVVSGSMEPAYRLNDLIYTVPTDCGKIQVGDTVSFVLPGTDAIATHRVIKNDVDQKQIFTKGDANDVADSAPVPYQNVKGVVRFCIPKIGAALMAFSSKLGRIITVTVGVAIILISMILALGGEEQQPERKKDRVRKQAATAGPGESPGKQAILLDREKDPTPGSGFAREPSLAYQGGVAFRPSAVGSAVGANGQVSQTICAPPEKRQPRTKKELPPGWR